MLYATTTVVSAQHSEDCEQLAIEFHGMVNSNDVDQLFFEVSNALYTGNLYYYPGFVLLNEQGDTIAKEETKYYGIGSNFQTHLLDIRSNISFPLVGRLELHGSYYQNFFCSFPIMIESAGYVDLKDIAEKEVKVATNYAGDHIIIDLGGPYLNEEELKYHFNITNENGAVSYFSELTTNITSIPVKSIGESGNYFVSIWDEANEILLPTKLIRID